MPTPEDAASHSEGYGPTTKRFTNLSTISTTLFRTLKIQRARDLYAKNGTLTLPDISPRRLFRQWRSTSSPPFPPVQEISEDADYPFVEEPWSVNLDLPYDLVAEEFDWIMYCHSKVFVPHSLETIEEVEENLYPNDWIPAMDTGSLRTGQNSEQSSDCDEEIFSLSNKESLCSLCFLAGRPMCRHTLQEWRPTLRISQDDRSIRCGVSEQELELDEETEPFSRGHSGPKRDLCPLCFLADRDVCYHALRRDWRPTLREKTEASSLRSQQESEQDEGGVDAFVAAGRPGSEPLCSLCFLTGRTVCHHPPTQDRPTLRRQPETPPLVSEHSEPESEQYYVPESPGQFENEPVPGHPPELEHESGYESERDESEGDETLVDNTACRERLCPLCFLAERSVCRHRAGGLSRQSVSMMVR